MKTSRLNFEMFVLCVSDRYFWRYANLQYLANVLLIKIKEWSGNYYNAVKL